MIQEGPKYSESNWGSDPILQGLELSRAFGDGATVTRAVDQVSLEVHRGQFVLMMGPSGSGKSTLLAILSGLLTPDEGRVVCMGEDIWSLNDKEREQFRLDHCGFIFQGYNLFPALTARQQLEIVARWGQGATAAEARDLADSMLQNLRMLDRAHLRPAQLSGGEKQRVAIGRALIKAPDLLFADEPTSALDWSHGEEVVKLLRSLSKDYGTTVVCVTHDHRLVPFADRMIDLEDGRLKRQSYGFHGACDNLASPLHEPGEIQPIMPTKPTLRYRATS